jgi:hypothetical protein
MRREASSPPPAIFLFRRSRLCNYAEDCRLAFDIFSPHCLRFPFGYSSLTRPTSSSSGGGQSQKTLPTNKGSSRGFTHKNKPAIHAATYRQLTYAAYQLIKHSRKTSKSAVPTIDADIAALFAVFPHYGDRLFDAPTSCCAQHKRTLNHPTSQGEKISFVAGLSDQPPEKIC